MAATATDDTYISISGVLVGMLFTLFVTLLLSLTAYSAWSQDRAFALNGESAQGRVVALSSRVVGAGEDRDIYYSVTYEVSRGSSPLERIEQAVSKEYYARLRQGAAVEVVYVPQQPELIRLEDEFLDSGLDITIPCAIGASIFGLAFLGLLKLLLYGLRRRQAET